MVMLIGVKLVLIYFFNSYRAPPRVNFNSPSDYASWIFWGLMLAAFATGFMPRRRAAAQTT
jgi:hypothetical protein